MPVPIHPVVRQLLETNALVRQTAVVKLRRNGFSESLPQLQVMAILAAGPHNLSELAERQGVTLACMSSTVSRMVDRGLVKRRRSAEDRRQVFLELLPRGKAVLDAAWKVAEAEVGQLLAPLSAEERESLRAGLEVMRKVFAQANGLPR